MVFVDFGRNKVYALNDNGDEIMVFDDFAEMVDRLQPATIVADSYPRKLQPVIAGLAGKGMAFLRLKDLGKVKEERLNNGLLKTNENDVRVLRQLFRKKPDNFQPLYTSPEELTVRTLTELWVEVAGIRKAAKHARTSAEHPTTIKVHRTLQNITRQLSEEIHEEAVKLQLYRRAFEELGLKGPTLAYIISHDEVALRNIPRRRLIIRYQMTGRRRYRGRNTKSRLLVLLAEAAVIHKHHRYHQAFQQHFERFRAEGIDKKKAFWKGVLRVAETILKDLHNLAKN